MTKEEALNVLWSAKTSYLVGPDGRMQLDGAGDFIPNPKWCDAFVYATLAVPNWVEHERRTIPVGTRVLVTMVSRFGDVGIRDRDLVPASNGYCARVDPDALRDWGDAP